MLHRLSEIQERHLRDSRVPAGKFPRRQSSDCGLAVEKLPRQVIIAMGAGLLLAGLLIIGFPLQTANAAENPLFNVRQSRAQASVERPRAGSNETASRFLHRGKDLRGWEHLADRMLDNGLDPERIIALFTDRRMPKRESLYFSVKPRESRALYRGHNTPKTRKNALTFYAKHSDSFEKAEEKFAVPREIILAILQIETRCGQYTGNNSVLYRLARLASAADPTNISANQRAYRIRDKSVSPLEVAQRANWLEDTFLPHTLATITLADRLGVDPFDIKGSNAGAIGYPQFLPGNIDIHGADGNGNGRVDLFDPEDAIHSVGQFLLNHGWNADTRTQRSKHEVLLHYNRSDSYVETVLAMANALKPSLK